MRTLLLLLFVAATTAACQSDAPGADVDELAKKLDIDIDRPLTQMSSGMKRKVALLAVLVPKVPLIILDEPTNTLDPTMRDELLDQLKAARGRGQAVLFSSHVLQEVEAVCDRVEIIHQGRVVFSDTIGALEDFTHGLALQVAFRRPPDPAVLASLPGLQAAASGQGLLSVDLQGAVVRQIPLVLGIGDALWDAFRFIVAPKGIPADRKAWLETDRKSVV